MCCEKLTVCVTILGEIEKSLTLQVYSKKSKKRIIPICFVDLLLPLASPELIATGFFLHWKDQALRGQDRKSGKP